MKDIKSLPVPFWISSSNVQNVQKQKTCDHHESSSKHFEHHAVCQQFFAKMEPYVFQRPLAVDMPKQCFTRLSSGAHAKGSAIQGQVFYSFMIYDSIDSMMLFEHAELQSTFEQKLFVCET